MAAEHSSETVNSSMSSSSEPSLEMESKSDDQNGDPDAENNLRSQAALNALLESNEQLNINVMEEDSTMDSMTEPTNLSTMFNYLDQVEDRPSNKKLRILKKKHVKFLEKAGREQSGKLVWRIQFSFVRKI